MRGIIFSVLSVFFFWGCSEEYEPEIITTPESLNEPCTVTIDLNDSGSRLAFNQEENVMKSTWSEGDKFEIYKNDVCYTFTLDEGCEGSSVGTFTSPTTPPRIELNGYYGNLGEWYSGNFYYELYFPSKDGYNNISFKNQVQNADGNMSHLKDKITMYHQVAHYTDIRFNNKNYTTGVEFPNFFSPYTVQTNGDYFRKNTIIKINASNLPEEFQPVSLKLESLSEQNIIVPFVTHNTQNSFTNEHAKAEMTLQNFDKDKRL